MLPPKNKDNSYIFISSSQVIYQHHYPNTQAQKITISIPTSYYYDNNAII